MALIDTSYFIQEINIPDTDRQEVQEVIDGFITKHEDELLEDVLGYSLYKAFKANSSESRIQDIIKGKEYTDSYGKLKKWKGLIQEQDDPYKFSLIANYVYYYYMRNQATFTTAAGEVIPGAKDNVKAASMTFKLTKAWNSISKDIRELMQFLSDNNGTYPEWDGNSLRVLRKYAAINPYGF